MKKCLTFTVLLLALLTAKTVFAEDSIENISSKHPFGLGIELGEPTGLTGKYWLNEDRAIQGGLSYSFHHFMLINGDYLFHFPRSVKSDAEFARSLVPYVGIGAMLFLETSTSYDRSYFDSHNGSVGLAIRIPLGIEWLPKEAEQLGFFVELAPGIGFVPSTFALLDADIGMRLYF